MRTERVLPADPPPDLLLPATPVGVFGAKTNGDVLTILTVAVRARDLQLEAWRQWWASANEAAKAR